MLIITKLIAKYVIVYYTILLSFLVFENFHLKYLGAGGDYSNKLCKACSYLPPQMSDHWYEQYEQVFKY